MRALPKTTLSYLFAAAALVAGCTPKNLTSSKVTISFPKSAGARLEKADVSSAGAFDPAAYCFTVNVTAADLPENTAKKQCDPDLRVYAGAVGAGDQLELQVPQGKARELQVYAFPKPLDLTACPSTTDGFGSLNRENVYKLGSQTFDALEPEVTVAVSVSTPSASNSLMTLLALPTTCGPTPTPSPTPTPTPTPAPADTTPPSLALSTTAPDPFNTGSFVVTATFSESVTGFSLSSVTITNGAASSLSGSGSSYTFSVTPSGQGLVTIAVGAGAAQDTAANASLAATNLTRTFSSTSPTVSISSSATSSTNVSPLPITVTFSAPVTGFDASDLVVTNGSVGGFTGSGSTYTFNLTPAGQGAVTVDINSGVALDSASNGNLSAVSFTRAYDTVQPTVALASAATDPFNTTSFTVTATLSESVTGLTASDFTITNGTLSGFSGSGASYNFTVTPSGQGLVTVALGANAAQDAAGNGNTAATNLTRTFDSTVPTVTLASAASDPLNAATFSVTATFSESVTGFALGDLTVTNGTASALSGSGSTYTFTVTPTGQGLVTVALGSGAAQDAAGNGNTAATSLTRSYDSTTPTLTLSSAAASTFNSPTFMVTATFSESVTGFTASDLTLTNGTASALSGSGTTYSFTVTPSGQGPVTVAVNANVAQDTAGNGNTAATSLTRTYDSAAPTVVITSSASSSTNVSPIPYTITFSENVTGFISSDVLVGNGTITGFTGSGTTYTMNVIPTTPGVVTVDINAGTSQDAAGNGNLAATQFTLTYDTLQPTVTLTSAIADPFNTSPFSVTATFSESVTNFVLGDITVTNGTAAAFSGSGATYTFTITPSGQGLITVAVNASVAQDAAGNTNTAAANLTRTYDSVAPSVVTIAAPPTTSGAFSANLTFSENVTGLTAGDFTITNGTINSVSGSGTSYSIAITPATTGSVTLTLQSNAVSDSAGNNGPSSTSSVNTTYSVPTWSQQAYLKAANAEAYDSFGYSVAASGDAIVVGAIGEASNQTTITNGATASTNNSAANSGAVYVFRRTGTAWAEEAYLKAPNAAASSGFGKSVAINGDTVIVGATGESSNQTTITNGTTASNNTSASLAGAAYVFRRVGGAWVQEAYLKASNAESSDEFGTSVAVHGDTVLIGAPWESSNQTTITNGMTAPTDNGALSSGAAYVFQRVGTNWMHAAFLKAANAEASDQFGSSVALYRDTAVVSAPSEDSNQTTITNGPSASTDNSAANSGAVYVFRKSGATWAQEAYIKAANAESSDSFGYSVSVNGDTLVVGAAYEKSSQTTITNGTTASGDNLATSSGAAYVYRRSGSTWAQEAYLKASNAGATDYFGSSVAIDGDKIVVGAPGEASSQTTISNGATASTNNSAASAGAAYVFHRSGTTWAQTAYLKAPNAASSDSFGTSVAFSGNTIVVGANMEDSSQNSVTNDTTASIDDLASNAGAAYVIQLSAPYATLASTVGLPTTTIDASSTSLSLLIRGSGVTYYRYKIGLAGSTDCSSPDGYTSDIMVGTPLFYNLLAFAENSSITLCVVGVDASGNVQSYANATSHTWVLMDTTFPTTPSGLTVSPSVYPSITTSPNISWTAASDTNLIGYQVAVGTSSGGTNIMPWRFVGNVTSTQLSGLSLTDGSSYFVSVRAIDRAGNISAFISGVSWTVSLACAGSVWCHQAYLKAPNAGATDYFGYSVAASGDTVVVGAYNEDSSQTTITNGATASSDNSLSAAGAAYVFRRTGGSWAQEAYLKAPNPHAADLFGWSVAISGDTIVVGAVGESSNQTTITNGAIASSDTSALSAGAAYVFRRTGAVWAQEAYLKAPNAEASDYFGRSVAVDGNTVVVGAYKESSNQTTITNGTSASGLNGATNSGAAYVFRREAGLWAQEAYLKAPNVAASAFFGYSVAVSGDTVLVGAYGESSSQTTITNGSSVSSSTGATQAGAAYVFRRTGTTWTHEAYLKAPNATTLDYFGFSVALSGDTAVVGAYNEDSAQTTITNGATASADKSALSAGAAYVFRRTGTTWAQEAYLKAPNANAYDYFGYSVGVSGDTIVVGAYAEASNQTTISNGAIASADNSLTEAGAAYVFRRSGAAWAQDAYIKAPNAGTDRFGYSSTVSGDSIVVGAYMEDSSQTTITNGPTITSNETASDSGAAYVFHYGLGIDAKTVGAAEIEYNPVGGESVNFAVQYSDDNTTWMTAGSTILSPTGQRTNRVAFSPVGSHRYWRIAFGDINDACISNPVTLAEVKLFNLNGMPVDLAAKTIGTTNFTSPSNSTDANSSTVATYTTGTCVPLMVWDFGS